MATLFTILVCSALLTYIADLTFNYKEPKDYNKSIAYL